MELKGLKDFLEEKDPEKYDFKDLMWDYYECYYKEFPGKYKENQAYKTLLEGTFNMTKEEDPVKKWYLYETLDEGRSFLFDCDNSSTTCQLAAEVYEALWSKDVLAFCKKEGTPANEQKETFVGETMNSVLTTLNELAKSEFPKNQWSWEAWKKLYGEDDSHKKFKQFFDAHSEVKEFIKVAHTIGNFIPWPTGCNGPRGIGPVKDYWDLTLYYIYCWYHDVPEQRDCHLEKIFGGKNQEQHVKTLKMWLKMFRDENGRPSWDAFVEANFLQDYTEWNTRPYGRPKQFWDRHFLGSVLPQTKEQIEAFFERATKCIKARSELMVAALNGEGQ